MGLHRLDVPQVLQRATPPGILDATPVDGLELRRVDRASDGVPKPREVACRAHGDQPRVHPARPGRSERHRRALLHLVAGLLKYARRQLGGGDACRVGCPARIGHVGAQADPQR